MEFFFFDELLFQLFKSEKSDETIQPSVQEPYVQKYDHQQVLSGQRNPFSAKDASR